MKDEEKKNITFASLYFSPAGGSIFEQIYNPKTGDRNFINWDQPPKKEGKLIIKPYLELGDNSYIYPIQDKEALEEGAILLPSNATEYGSLDNLIVDIRTHIHSYVDVSNDFEQFATWYVLLTWIYDRLNTLPYLRALGDTGTGKSRFLDVIGRICYKPMIVSGAVTPAPIYRMIRKWGGTIILDEADIRKSDETSEVITILNCGFERGRPVIRCTKDNPDNLQTLPTFCPKIFATRRRFIDPALESRCLTEIMRETSREDIPNLLPKRFYEKEIELRNKLLMFRFKNWRKIDVENAQNLNLGNIEPRLKQSTSPFAVLFANFDGVMNDFRILLSNYNKDLIEQRATTFDGIIINSLYELIQEKAGETPVTNETIETVETQIITSQDIRDKIQRDYVNKEVSPQKVGIHLKSLGLETKIRRLGNLTPRAIVWDVKKFKKLFTRYIVSFVSNVSTVTGTEHQMPIGGKNEIGK